LTGLRFNAPVAAARLANGFATATDLAETITLETGLDFRTTHRIVGRLVREATQANRTMRDLTTADLDAAAQVILNRPLQLSEAAFVQALDPAAAVAARQGIGGAAPEPLAAMLTECRTMLDTCTSWHKKAAARTSAAEEALVRCARELCGGE
jgi:argininosuccinate lyase